MYKTTLRKVGGSVMLAVPPPLLDLLDLEPGVTVGLSVEKNRLVIAADTEPRYSLAELLAECDQSSEPSADDRSWDRLPPVGRELL